MNQLLRLMRLCLGGCRHKNTYRERRKLHSVDVLHWVCEDCGHAVPAVQRTAREHRRAVKDGAIKPAMAHRANANPAGIVALESRRPARRAQA